MSTLRERVEGLVEELRTEAKNEEHVATVEHTTGRQAWGFQRTAEALKRYAFKLEQLIRLSGRTIASTYQARARPPMTSHPDEQAREWQPSERQLSKFWARVNKDGNPGPAW